MLAGVILPPKTAGLGSPLLSAVPQGKLRQGASGTEEWRYLEEELQLGTEAVQLPAPVRHWQVLLPVAAVQLGHGLCGMAGLSWQGPAWAASALPRPTPPFSPPPGSQPWGFLAAGERGTCTGTKKGSRGSEGHRYPLGTAGPLRLAGRTGAGSRGSVGMGCSGAAPAVTPPPLPSGWVRGGSRQGQGVTCHAGDTLAGDRLAHLLCRSLMTRLSSPSPAMAVPWGSAKAGAVRRGARLVLTWHPQTLSPKERVCPPPTPPWSCLLIR